MKSEVHLICSDCMMMCVILINKSNKTAVDY